MARAKGSPDRRKNGRQKTAKNPTAAGRPRKTVDFEQLDKLCWMHCTIEEIAAFFEVSQPTLAEIVLREKGVKLYEYYSEKRQGGKISLRRAQWRSAEKSVPMQIFLGKNYLSQSDGHKLAVSGDVNVRTDIADRLVKMAPDILEEIWPLGDDEE